MSVNTRHFQNSFYASSAFALCLFGCNGEESSTSDTASTEYEVVTAQEDIRATDDSRATAKEEAKTCFDAFASCKQAAGADEAACRLELAACLPDRAPEPDACEEGRRGQRPPRVEEDGAAEGDRPRGPREDEPVVDREIPDDQESANGRRPERRPDPGHRGPAPSERIRECCEKTRGDLANASDVDNAAEGHAACISRAFDDQHAAICSRASELCAREDAPADACRAVSERCAQQ